jgi:hypothetical protein
MKPLSIVLCASLCFTGAAVAAEPGGEFAGTWECRQPGVEYNNKPPIVYFSGAAAKVEGQAALIADVDGFARKVYGLSELTPDQDGWWKVKPAEGEEFLVRTERASKTQPAAMGLRRAEAKAEYRCLRIPAAKL